MLITLDIPSRTWDSSSVRVIDIARHWSPNATSAEGLNGRLPNQDLLNSVSLISRHTGGVPVLVHDHKDPRDTPGEPSLIPSWVPDALKSNKDVLEYSVRARNIVRHMNYQARGVASGVHGLFHQFRIDAITIFAVPATGPHGFHAIGR